MRDYVDQINSIRLCAGSDDPVDECCWEDCNQHHGNRDNMCRQKIMVDAADAIEELLAECRDVAAFVIHYADDDEVSAEVLCRKLHKIGVVEKDGAWWTLPEAPEEVE